MREYGKILPWFWTRGSGKNLRGDKSAQILAAYLFTAPGSNMAGLYYVSPMVMGHETGLSESEVLQALGRLEREKIAFYDFEAELVFVPEMARIQIDELLDPKDNRVKGVLREASVFRTHPFYYKFWERYYTVYGFGRSEFAATVKPPGWPAKGSEGPLKGSQPPFEGVSVPLRSQEQEQDQEHDQEHEQERFSGGVSEPGRARAPRTRPHEDDLCPAGKRILVALRTHPALRPVATPRFAETILAYTTAAGGTHDVADVAHSVLVAGENEAAALATGDLPKGNRDLAHYVVGLVRKTRKGEGRKNTDAIAEQAELVTEYGRRWKRCYRRDRVPDRGDEAACGELLESAQAEAKEGIKAHDIVLSWFDQHLANQDRFLTDQQHPLWRLPKMLSQYEVKRPKPRATEKHEVPLAAPPGPVVESPETRAAREECERKLGIQRRPIPMAAPLPPVSSPAVDVGAQGTHQPQEGAFPGQQQASADLRSGTRGPFAGQPEPGPDPPKGPVQIGQVVSLLPRLRGVR